MSNSVKYSSAKQAPEQQAPVKQSSIKAVAASADLTWDADNIPFSSRWGDRYFSAAGAREESLAVFHNQSRLLERWRDSECFVIGELGFGSAINLLLAWQLWRESSAEGVRQKGARLHYISCEATPMSPDSMRRAFGQWPELAELGERLLQQWPIALSGVHRLNLGDNLFLTLLIGDVRETLPTIEAQVDAWFLDGFAPSCNAEMWEEGVVSQVARLSSSEATVATYTVAGVVRRNLERYGFTIEKRPGFGRKSEMLFGVFRGEPKARKKAAAPRRVAVLGAGLAGAAAARSCALRGAEVEIFDRESELARGASGNVAGIVMPHVAFPQEAMSRWYRSAYASFLSHLRELEIEGASIAGSRCGVVRLATSDRFRRFYNELLQAGGDGPYIEALPEGELSRHAGVTVKGDGFFIPHGGWVSPRDLTDAELSTRLSPMGEGRVGSIVFRGGVEISSLCRIGERWQVLATDGEVLTEVDSVIISLGPETLSLQMTSWLPLESVRGQIITVPSPKNSQLKSVLCYDGYLIPDVSGRDVVGATFDHNNSCAEADPEQSAALLRRLSPWTEQPFEHSLEAADSRVSFRAMSRDRLPLVGPLPDLASLAAWRPPFRNESEILDCVVPGVYLSVGHGSRGIISSHLAGEILAHYIYADPAPIERELLRASLPQRFALRIAKRGELVDESALRALQVPLKAS